MMHTECKPAPADAARTLARVRGRRGGRFRTRGQVGLVACILIVTALGAARAAPLAGRIWSPDEQRFVEPGAVIAAVRAAPFVLLGETHTVARHHTLQARLVRAIASDDRRPPIVLEMVGRNRQTDIEQWRQAPAPDAEAFGPAVDWRKRGWPPWPAYRPIVDAALAYDLAIRAGGPAATLVRRVASEGLTALADHTDPTFAGLDAGLDDTAERCLRAALKRAHCGLAEHSPIDRMIAIQRLRDAAMAHAMIAVDAGDGAILIAGRGHVRADYGVPVYLQRGAPERDAVTIAFVGTAGRRTIARQREAAGGTLPFDYVWFTKGGTAAPDCTAEDSR